MPWKKNFDVDLALQRAGETFWSHGYEATSVRDLLDAMGIQKGSFYDTYGSKKEAYLRALEQYAAAGFERFEQMCAGLGPKASLHTQIEAIYEDCISREGHRGCMVINCALELAHSDTAAQRVVQRAFEAHEESYGELIRAGQAAGEISADLDPDATAKAMLALVIGMRVFARCGAPKATLRTLADQALELLER